MTDIYKQKSFTKKPVLLTVHLHPEVGVIALNIARYRPKVIYAVHYFER